MPKYRVNGQKTEASVRALLAQAAEDDRRRGQRSAGLTLDEKLARLREREMQRPPPVVKAKRKKREKPIVDKPLVLDTSHMNVDEVAPVRPIGSTDVARDEISGALCGDATFMLKAYYDDAGYSGLRVNREERFDRQTWSLINRLCVPVSKAKW